MERRAKGTDEFAGDVPHSVAEGWDPWGSKSPVAAAGDTRVVVPPRSVQQVLQTGNGAAIGQGDRR